MKNNPFIPVVWSAVLALGTTGCSNDSSTPPEDESVASPRATAEWPFMDTTRSVDARVDDLVGRLTLEEKAAQMMNAAPAIERLGIPEYNWWSEALHGVARAGLATVFPQAIALGATWNQQLMFDVATAISDEARAKHHAFAARDKRFIYQGLTLWSPNINIFRDPRWGRGQETYGEDPFLTGAMGVQFIRGLQGDDPTYLKTIASAKHFAVHSGPEPERHSFNATAGLKDFYGTYTPQFARAVRDGRVQSVMCAYNRYNGEAACASDFLNKTLRTDMGFDGFVVSDCGAIADLHEHHKITGTAAESAALAVKNGTDLNCGTVYAALPEAVQQGLITESEIDVALKRLFRARMQLGMFDPPEQVKYTQIPYTVVDSEPHRKLALRAAEESIVLLKNDNNTLPLRRDSKNIAVIGPNADKWLMLLGNYNGVPSTTVTPLQGIRQAVSLPTRITYAQGSEWAKGIPVLSVIPAEVWSHGGKSGLKATFFDNHELQGKARFSEVHATLDSNWHDQAPRDDMDDDNFGVRWTADLTAPVSGTYQLGIISTCRTKVYLDKALILAPTYHFRDEYGDPRTFKSEPLQLEAGQKYRVVVEAGETYADAQVQLVWAPPRPDLKAEAVQVAEEADAVVLVMGLTAQMEGEEMPIEVPGFKGGDRTRLDLPKPQRDLIKAVAALKKPTVLVVLNGSALALNWESRNIPAIVEAWYPGQAGGAAIARVLFGDYNPAGRLPLTFYRSTNDLPAFEDYNMTRQTYRYFDGKPLYPFGYGLSYTTFEYSALQFSETIQSGQGLSVSAQIRNTGSRAGDEVVQVYLSHLEPSAQAPVRQLAAFERLHLPVGETRTVRLEVPAEAFSYIDQDGKKQRPAGRYEFSMGGGQPYQLIQTTSNVLIGEVRLVEEEE